MNFQTNKGTSPAHILVSQDGDQTHTLIMSDKETREQLLIELAAKNLRLPPGEQAFMNSIARCGIKHTAGYSASFSFNDTRQARGIQKKGLATIDGCDIVLTELGAAWLRSHCVVAA